ncbi:MAG TPA: OmpH family outer membrane protein [Chitinophagaceae bacterium]|nr:OmpH family outer membrane protein [Chitinophagaceae bacterium]
MRNISILLFVVLFVLVALLYYLQFSGKVKKEDNVSSKENTEKPQLNVAYVDIDSLETNYEYYKQVQKNFEKKRDSIDRALNNDYNAIENERIKFIQRGSAITEVEAENFKVAYQQKMQNLEGKRQQLAKELGERQSLLMDDVLRRIESFLNEYNKQKNYTFVFGTAKGSMMFLHKDTAYNITSEVLKGLNLEYRKTAKN